MEKTYIVRLTGPKDLDLGVILENAMEYALAHERLDAYKFEDAAGRMTRETHAFIVALFEYYAESSSGEEEENRKELDAAWKEINVLAGSAEQV